MLHCLKPVRGCLKLLGALALTVGFAFNARASDPLPGDLVTPPVNINIGLGYNYFTDTGQFGQVHGGSIKNNTHLSDDIVVARYIRTFMVDGFNAGVQAYVPYVAFIGNQQIGVPNIPGPIPGFPAFGPGRASLSSNDGFGQPNFSAFFYPIDNPATGTYAVISPWISPPVSSFDKNKSLNPGTQNVWTYELEDGVRTRLFGTATTPNLSIEVWDTLYVYGNNGNSALVQPSVSADNISPLYQSFGITNPLQPASSTPATFREQPTNEIRVYLPYEFAPAMRAFIAPGFYQSFGGKATYKINGFGVVDSGTRTNGTQLRLVASTFLSPRLAVMLAGYFDVAAHGGPLNRYVVLRLATFF